jgi:hypothetical protein
MNSVSLHETPHARHMIKKTYLLFLLLQLCALPTMAQLSTVWDDTRFLQEPMKKVMLIVQFHDEGLREEASELLLKAIGDKGVGMMDAYCMLHYDSMYRYSTLERKLDSAEVDGILIARLVDVRESDMYIMPGDVIPPYAYNYFEYYSFYYYNDLGIITRPGYYEKQGREFRIDLNLYQNRGDMIVWGAQYRLSSYAKTAKALSPVAKATAKALLSKKLVQQAEKNGGR